MPNGFTYVVIVYHTTTWVNQENWRISPLDSENSRLTDTTDFPLKFRIFGPLKGSQNGDFRKILRNPV